MTKQQFSDFVTKGWDCVGVSTVVNVPATVSRDVVDAFALLLDTADGMGPVSRVSVAQGRAHVDVSTDGRVVTLRVNVDV